MKLSLIQNSVSFKKWLLPLACGLLISSFQLPAGAQLASTITLPTGNTLSVTGRNMNRGQDALILYTRSFGSHTKTNPHGSEVILTPMAAANNAQSLSGDGIPYQVTAITHAVDCSNNSTLKCGNAEIPEKGVVLSATGIRREDLRGLKIGDVLNIIEDWIQSKSARLNVVDPSPQNNPAGSGFPGYRASNQIVLYDSAYGRPSTGTNEFGFEVTVRNGIVVAQEGSDSTIPEDGFVLSGHGKGRAWLIANTPPGAHITLSPDKQTVSSTIDFDTYLYQFDQRWAESPCGGALWSMQSFAMDPQCHSLRDARDQAVRMNASKQNREAVAKLNETLEGLNRRIWLSYAPFPNQTIRGAWHRPVEKNAAAVGKTLDTLQAAGLNAVFLETYFHGYTIFPSQTFQAYGLPAENPRFDGVDLLQLWITEAHKRHMQVHTWFQTFYGGTKSYMPPGPILAKYPDWANVQFVALKKIPFNPPTLDPSAPAPTVVPKSIPALPLPVAGAEQPTVYIYQHPDKPVPSNLELGAYFLDPANPKVQDFVDKLALEIVSRYDIDGFQLDYIRYPASFPSDRFSYRRTTWGYTDVTRAAFKAQYGIDPVDIDPKNPDQATLWISWGQFKTQQVNHFVDRVSHDIHRIKPGLKISAAVFPNSDSALTLKHQDWPTWGRNGWVDFFAPMTLTSALKVIENDTRTMVQATQNRVPVYSGIFGPFNDNTADLLLSQIDTARKAGAQGFVLFDTAHITGRMLEALHTMQTPHNTFNSSMLLPKNHQTVDSSPAAPGSSTAEQTGKRRHKGHWWHRESDD